MVLRHSFPELKNYFSFTGHRIEEVVFWEHNTFSSLEFSFSTRQAFLQNLPQGKVLICEWDRDSLFKWAVKLTQAGIPFGVPGDYKGENLFLSTPFSLWGLWDTGFFGASPKAQKLPYLKAFTHAKKVVLALEDLLIWGALEVS